MSAPRPAAGTPGRRRIAIAALVAALFLAGAYAGYGLKKHRVDAAAARAATERAVAERAETARAAAAARAAVAEGMRADLADIRSLTEALEPRLKAQSGRLQVALLLRNLMYHRIPFLRDTGAPTRPYDWMKLAEVYSKSVLDPRYGHACGGRVIQYLVVLKAFGFVARRVALYGTVENATENFPSHASVDVRIDDKWIALDPHFNFSLRRADGSRIGWEEAAGLIANGRAVSVDHDGFAVKPGYDIDTYFRAEKIGLAELARHMTFGPYRDAGGASATLKRPAGWDGVIHYRNGTAFAAFSMDGEGIYRALAELE